MGPYPLLQSFLFELLGLVFPADNGEGVKHVLCVFSGQPIQAMGGAIAAMARHTHY